MYEKHDPDGGWEAVEEADIPPWVAALGVAGYYVGRALLVLGLVCFLAVGLLLAAGGAP